MAEQTQLHSRFSKRISAPPQTGIHFGLRSRHDRFHIAVELSNSFDETLNLRPPVHVVLHSYGWPDRHFNEADRAQRSSEAVTNVGFENMETRESLLSHREVQFQDRPQQFLSIGLTHLEKHSFQKFGSAEPSDNARVNIQELWVKVDQHETPFSQAILMRNIMCSSCNGIRLTSEPEDRYCGRSRDNNAESCDQQRNVRNNKAPSIPIYCTAVAHRPALVKTEPPIHSLIPLWINRHFATPCQQLESDHG